MRARLAALNLRLRLLDEPCLWCWEIVDSDRGDAPVRSSWAASWTAYETRAEALAAGRAQLADLRRGRAEGAAGRHGRKRGRAA